MTQTYVSQTIGEHNTDLDNEPVNIYIYIYIYIYILMNIYIY